MAEPTKEPPLITVTNPVTYLRRWWDKVMGKEGIDFRFTIHPVTAVLMVAVIATIGFGVGRFVLPESIKIPFFEFGKETPIATPKEETETWKETAYIGTLKYSISTQKYFLVTSSAAEAITLEVPANLNLSTLVEKRIMVIGKYSKSLRVIQVMDTKDMEILSNTPIPIPTITPTAVPTANSDSSSSGGLNNE